jgi:small subunit ribosomal protein S3
MGQKVNPTGFRLGVSKKQNANWYAKGKDFSTNLIQDLKVREYFKTKLKNSSISKIELERSAENFVVSIYTSRPGIIIGKRGEEIDNLKRLLKKLLKDRLK